MSGAKRENGSRKAPVLSFPSGEPPKGEPLSVRLKNVFMNCGILPGVLFLAVGFVSAIVSLIFPVFDSISRSSFAGGVILFVVGSFGWVAVHVWRVLKDGHSNDGS